MTPEHPIILCGFTSSGKTTIGKLLSEQLGLPFYDTDQMLIEHYKMTIPEIFAKGGESLFRDYEHEIARQVCGLGPSVVSTGGGMLTFDRNGEILEKSGTIFYIDRPFEDCYRNLALHPERPLFKNHTKEEIEKQNLTLLGVVPMDNTVYRFDCDGRPMVELPQDSPVRSALRGIVEKLGL